MTPISFRIHVYSCCPLQAASLEDYTRSCLGSITIKGLGTSKISLIHALQTAFGSYNEQRSMDSALLRSGEYGLPRFYSTIVAPVLDTEDNSHANYSYHFDILQACCIALTKKLDNDSKVHYIHAILTDDD